MPSFSLDKELLEISNYIYSNNHIESTDTAYRYFMLILGVVIAITNTFFRLFHVFPQFSTILLWP